MAHPSQPQPQQRAAPSSRKRLGARTAILTGAILAACAAGAPLALAADTDICGAEQVVPWWNGPVQPCALTSPAANHVVPLYRAPVAYSQAPVPPPDGKVLATSDRPFVCQQPWPGAEVVANGARSTWWAFTVADEGGVQGWVSEVFFQGNADDEPDGGLRRCPEQPAATPVQPGLPPATPPPPPIVPPSGTPADGDHDGTPDVNDTCPTEDARKNDANLNGCLDLLRLRPAFKVKLGSYYRVVGNRNKLLGITTRKVTFGELPTGARVSLSCTRGACPFQRLTAKAGRRIEFKQMRGRKLPTGVRMTLRATLPGRVGAGVTYTALPNDKTTREFCIRPSGRKGSCSTKR